MVSRYCECSLGKVSTRKQGRNRKIQCPTMDGSVIHGLQRLFMVAVRLAHCLGDYLGDWMVRKVSDKERLEEVVENVVFLRGLTGSLNAELPEDDFWYLYEQAERVQELEKQNKRYKQALEYIQRAIHTQHCTKNHKWNSEFEKEFKKGQTIGLIQASNIVDKAIRKVEGEE